MADLLSIGASALLADQTLLNTVSQNIANVNTPSYSRQRVNLTPQQAQFTGAGYIGSGVQVSGVQRVYDQFLNNQVVTNTSAQNQLQQLYQLSSQVDNLLGTSGSGVTTAVQNFFNSVQDVANSPTSTATREALLGSGQSVVQTFNTLSAQLTSLDSGVNQNLTNAASNITSLAQGIAQLNQQIVNAQAAGQGVSPNDLLDQRDALVTQLAQQVGVTTSTESNGALDVSIGSGQSLVVGLKAATLATVNNSVNPSQKDITLTFGSQSVVVTNQITGGQVGGMLQFRTNVLDPALNGLGRVAIGLAGTFNKQQQLGMDLNGQLGGNFFTVPQPQVLPNPGNSGSISVGFSNVGNLTTSDYTLAYNGSSYTLTRLSDGKNIPMSGAGTSTNPFVADGLSIVVGPGAAAGDQYLIQPTRLGAAQIGMAITDPSKVAAAAPVQINAATNSTGTPTNAGSGSFTNVAATTASGLPLSSNVTFTYDATAKVFNYSGAVSGSFAYDPTVDSGKTFSAGGIQFTVTGTPATGDQFVMSNNTSGSGDNSNAVLLAGLQSQPLLASGTATYSDTYGQVVANIGSQTQQANIAQQAQTALLQQAQQARDSVSGVNLDEEAANMIKFQQAYQAAAQVISVSNTLFQSLLSAVR
ncbi:MAG: flagellar hook-associated protein FlgK [Gammaproteobacteria bacterium]